MKKKVVIVGGGFGGLNAAREFAHHPEIDVLLIDQRNHHLFQPLLYQVAMAGLSPADIATPIRSLFAKNANIEVLLGRVTNILPDQKKVITEYGEIEFEYLILACGAQHSYFGKDQWEEFAPGLKTLEQATEIRRRILTGFEMAEREEDPSKKGKHLTFVVVGGGATGVELAGSLSEMSHHTLQREFHETDLHQTTIYLVEGSGRILNAFSENLSAHAANDLKEMGVTLLLNSKVTDINAEGVTVETKEGVRKIPSSTVIWAAGVQPSSLNKKLNLPMDPQGRVIINSDLSLPLQPNIFVIGDQAHFKSENGRGLPGVAQVAIQQGGRAAKNILLSLSGKPREEFVYNDKGQMATIGRKRAVLQAGKLELTGIVAWNGWLLVHIYYLIGFKNRFFVILQWMWSYVNYKRGARLIVDKDWKSKS